MGLTLHENPNKKHTKLSNTYLYIYIHAHIRQYTSWRGEGKNLLPCSVRKSTLNSQISFTKNISSADCLFHRSLRPTWSEPWRASSWLWTNWERKESASWKDSRNWEAIFFQLGTNSLKRTAKAPEKYGFPRGKQFPNHHFSRAMLVFRGRIRYIYIIVLAKLLTTNILICWQMIQMDV